MWRVRATLMNNLDTTLKRILVNFLFGIAVLLILSLAVTFSYFINKQSRDIQLKQYNLEQSKQWKQNTNS